MEVDDGAGDDGYFEWENGVEAIDDGLAGEYVHLDNKFRITIFLPVSLICII